LDYCWTLGDLIVLDDSERVRGGHPHGFGVESVGKPVKEANDLVLAVATAIRTATSR
jgi:hypothetical protein